MVLHFEAFSICGDRFFEWSVEVGFRFCLDVKEWVMAHSIFVHRLLGRTIPVVCARMFEVVIPRPVFLTLRAIAFALVA